MLSKLVFLTPAGGKRLIAMALVRREDVLYAVRHRTVVVVAGTTNAYLARELLGVIGTDADFPLNGFFRGIIRREPVPKNLKRFQGDVVIRDGKLIPGETIHTVGEKLREGDIIFKGANAVNLETGETAVLAGNPTSGTMGVIYRAAVGKRVRLITPVGVEKRVTEPVSVLCRLCNEPGAEGLRLAPSFGEAFTEMDAIRVLSGTEPHLVAGGGVCGCEGGVFFRCTGSSEQIRELNKWIAIANREPLFHLSGNL